MKRNFVAFLIMIVGIALSWFFLRPEEWSLNTGANGQAIARIERIINEVSRQSEGRLMWEPMKVGELVYMGDKVKTSAVSTVSLIFLKQNSKLEIEENSTVKMEGLDQRIALNMLEGRVFLKQEESKSASQVDVLTRGKKLDIQGSVAVAINQDGSSQVFDFVSDAKDSFKNLTPEYGSEVLRGSSEIKVSWKPSDSEGIVFIEAGESASALHRQPHSVDMKVGTIDLKAKPGINYWRLVTFIKNAPSYSALMRLTLRRPIPPTLVSPTKDEVLNLRGRKMEFRWSLGNVGNYFSFEISKDPGFKETIVKQEIEGQTFYTMDKEMPEGVYYWRVRSRQESSTDWFDEGPQKFKVTYSDALLSPGLIQPLDETIYYLDSKKNVNINFQWRNQPNTKWYEISLEGSNFSKKLKLDLDNVQINIPRAGTYSWSVVSQSTDGRDSISPIVWKLIVKDQEKLKWVSDAKIHTYLESLPIVILAWDKTGHRTYNLKISRRADFSKEETFQVSNRDFPYRPIEDGFYYAKIQGLDDQGQVSAVSEVYEFKVEKAPLPPSPKLQEVLLLANSRGELAAKFTNFQIGWRALSQLINSKGVVVNETQFLDDSISFKGLLPGVYTVQLTYLDSYGRKSVDASRFELKVPEKNLISAPKLKGIKIR